MLDNSLLIGAPISLQGHVILIRFPIGLRKTRDLSPTLAQDESI
jgi:hypothetical protein